MPKSDQKPKDDAPAPPKGARSEAETAKIRDATLKRMHKTPPKPHKGEKK